MPRAITVTIYIFCMNITFMLIEIARPFHIDLSLFSGDWKLVNDSVVMAANMNQTGGFGLFGLPGVMFSMLDLFITLILGPLKLVPTFLGLVGFDLLTIWIISSLVWVVYIIFVVQLITGRVFGSIT